MTTFGRLSQGNKPFNMDLLFLLNIEHAARKATKRSSSLGKARVYRKQQTINKTSPALFHNTKDSFSLMYQDPERPYSYCSLGKLVWYSSLLWYCRVDYRNLVWLTNHIDAAWEPANANTMTSRLGPVAAVIVGMLFAMVFSIKKEAADAVHRKAT